MIMENLNKSTENVVLAIGVFDGVHCGHREILRQLRVMAAKYQAKSVVISFDPHPRTVVKGKNAPQLLISPAERVRRIRNCGIDEVKLTAFTESLANMTPEAFLSSLLAEFAGRLRGICVGEHWRFGHKAAGNRELLAAFAAKHQMEFCPVPEVVLNGEIVSSSRIRELTAAGDLAQAAELLAAYPALTGMVEAGLHLAGQALAHPTANVKLHYGVLPPDGVYAATVQIGDNPELPYKAALNIGTTPTVRHLGVTERRIEAHLLDFSGNLYQQEIMLNLVKFIREERCFGTLDDLKKQITHDVAQITAALRQERNE